MVTDDELMGVKKAEMDELREIKVKLPVRQLLQLHYAKLTSARSISDVVADALIEYFGAVAAQQGHAPTPHAV
jgi:hypothetical protein